MSLQVLLVAIPVFILTISTNITHANIFLYKHCAANTNFVSVIFAIVNYIDFTAAKDTIAASNYYAERYYKQCSAWEIKRSLRVIWNMLVVQVNSQKLVPSSGATALSVSTQTFWFCDSSWERIYVLATVAYVVSYYINSLGRWDRNISQPL